MFAREDFQRMAELLAGLKGHFVMSINDRPEIREWFADFFIDEVRLSYSAGQNVRSGKVGELIISDTEARAGLL